MAYNLQPLIQILDQILHPRDHGQPHLSVDHHERLHIESLLEKSRYMIDAFETRLSVTGDDVQILEDRIRDAAHRAQNVIEFFLKHHRSPLMADMLFISAFRRMLAKERKEIFVGRREDKEKLKQIDEEFKLLIDEIKLKYKSVASSSHRDSAKKFLSPAQIFVGRREDVEKLKHSLTATEKSEIFEIIPILGVGGVGKTTLARTLYNDRSVISYFDCRAWVTIAESYSIRDILLGLLACFPVPGNHERKLDYEWREISRDINESLRGRRYLIVIDNILTRTIDDWGGIIDSFPNNLNGSRILVTTGDGSVANYVTAGSPHEMKFLDTESWDLLRRKVFGEGTCTPELEKLGEEISRYCWGLPLAIHLVGGILLYLEKTKKAWEQVAEGVKLCSDANDPCSVGKVLLLSYTHLPNYLKPCFLYMAAFPGGWEISSSKLIRLWVAEGFLKPIPGMSFEEAAEEYLMELVQRSLLMVHKQEIRGKVKSYIMHDLARDFCIYKAREEKFLYDGIDAMRELDQKDVLRLRLNTVNIPDDWALRVTFVATISDSVVSSLLLFGSNSDAEDYYDYDVHNAKQYLVWRFANRENSLLRVVHALGVHFVDMFPEDLFHLRYLAASGPLNRFPIIAYRNLQTLILNSAEYLSIGKTGLLDLPLLRHVTFKGKYPYLGVRNWTIIQCQELQTLSNVDIYSRSSFQEILKAIPNIRKLGIHSPYPMYLSLTNSRKLEILKCSLGIRPYAIPHTLKKLTIFNCERITNAYLHEIGLLPILEVLKLQCCSSDYEVAWMPTEGEFQNLRLLLLSWRNLRKWRSNEKHYPRLERLVIQDCCDLEEIPWKIGYIPSLEKIELLGECRHSAEESVKRMRDEKGNGILYNISIWRKTPDLPRILTRDDDDEFSLNHLSNLLSIAEPPAISASEIIASPRPIQKDDLQNPSDSGVVVNISLPGELSMSVHFTQHTINTSSNEMISFGSDPGKDDYYFDGVVKPKSGLDSRIMIRGDSESEELLTLDEWRQAYVVTLTDKEHISLPEEPYCPNLILLFLQRSNGIIDIPEKFFDHMPALCFVDLSGTRIRELPEPLYKKPQLQVLMLKNCNRLLTLRFEIEDLESLKVLDLSGTELLDLPHKIGQLSLLFQLKLSFYGPDDEREFAQLPHELMSTDILSKLEKLQVLSIEVHPEDYRWKNIAAKIIKDVANLKKLIYLQYYFPTEECLKYFTSKSPSWAERRLRNFKFIVGENVNRIVSRVPEEVENLYHKHDCCLRYVNGDKADEAVKTVLERTSAFYVDHISNIKSLTQFGISNFKKVTFCIVRECPQIDFLITSDERDESAFKKLEHLGIYYLWRLEGIWEDSVPLHNFERLIHLTVHTCPKLSFIVSRDMVECLSNLEELVVQHCDSLTEIIQGNAVGRHGGKVLPKLRRLVLRYLPELVTIGDGLSLSVGQILLQSCPKLNLIPQLQKLKQSSSCTVV